jgi:hypothetical protein
VEQLKSEGKQASIDPDEGWIVIRVVVVVGGRWGMGGSDRRVKVPLGGSMARSDPSLLCSS